MARVVLARRARRELLALDWPVLDAVQEALGLLECSSFAGFFTYGGRRRVVW